jgi:benzoyl-CoA reductase/2-hydroxyglutaryl-CoA dehydratase subunit BcrC/BadD/HgdB
MQDDIPELSGIVFMNSCDTMRRLNDAWQKVRPNDNTLLVDLPVSNDPGSVSFFAEELALLTDTLSQWSGNNITPERIENSIGRYNELAMHLNELKKRVDNGTLKDGSLRLQTIYNKAATEPIKDVMEMIKQMIDETNELSDGGLPVYLFGNVLPDPEAFVLFESCGARIVSEDLCTGSRMTHSIETDKSSDVFKRLANGLLSRTACARTVDPINPGKMALDVVERANACNARGVIGHTVKFCDPYLARMPSVRDALKKEGISFLLLEGDCTMRSIGQHKTRIEAFIEMLR